MNTSFSARISSVVLILTGLLTFVPQAQALTNYVSGDAIVLPIEETIEGDYFAAGESVSIYGTVNGDVYAAGGTVLIDGTVNGDVIGAGGTVTVKGTVDGNVRVAGGQINISGNVARNVTAMGGNITLHTPGTVAGSVTVAGGTIALQAPIEKNATIAGGQVTIDTSIGGDVTGGVGQLVMTPGTKVAGNLEYWSDEEGQIASSSAQGQVTYHQTDWEDKSAREAKTMNKGMAGAGIVWAVMNAGVAFLFGVAFLKLLPVFTRRVAETATTRPWLSMGLGAIAMFFIPVLCIFLMITIVGFPLAIVLIMAFILLMYFNQIFVAFAIGKKLLPRNEYVGLFVGLLILSVISLVPILGWMVGLISLWIGMGALLKTKHELFGKLRDKKIL